MQLLGLGDLARSGLQVEHGFADGAGLTAEERNAASFLQAPGVLPTAEEFRGADPVTQAEAAAVTARLYNYLQAQAR